MDVVRRIAEERENSQIVPSRPRTELQRVRLHGLYELLILLRIILTLNLQTGWIHQDELSNSIEVVAGDYFDLQVFKPDVFNSSSPTHSIALLHTTIYLPYIICNYFLSYTHPIGKEEIPNTKLLLLIPRIFHLLLSFLVDYILIKFCRLNESSRKKVHNGNNNKAKEAENVGESKANDTTHDPHPPGAETRRSRRRRRDPRRDVTLDSSEDEEAIDDVSDMQPRHRRRRKNRQKSSVFRHVENISPPVPPPSPPPNFPTDHSNDSTIRLVTLASSQVLLVFAPRSHPSSLNLTLFASLLYLVSASFHAYEEYIPLLEKYYSLPKSDGVGRVHLLKEMKASGYSSLNRLPLITFLTITGVWNDPEFFLSYACIPLFFYMQKGISHRLFGIKYFHARIFSFLLLAFICCLPFILWDSLYHGKVGWEDFRTLNLSPESFVITPVNYFSRKENQFRDWWGYLQILGLYLIVFNVLGVMGLVSFVKEVYDVMFAEWRHKPNLDSHWTFLNFSLFLPLFFLIQSHGNSYSVFDLAPLIFPLVYMHGHKIPLASRFSSKIGLSWFASNCVGVLYFGYLAQGGILTSFMDLSDNLTPIRFNDTQVDITFSQMTAIPPTFTLGIPTTWKTIMPGVTSNPHKEEDDLLSEMNPLDLSSHTEDFHFNFNPNTYNTDLPPTLYKTVLKLEQSSKLRVYHTGYSPLPMIHLERDLLRLIQNQDNMEQGWEKVSLLLIPHRYGRESEASFRQLRLTHIKTYWNHVFFNFIPESSESWKDWRNVIFGKNAFHFGLSLYRMEKVDGDDSEEKRRRMYDGSNYTKTKKMDKSFQKYFQLHDAFYDFLKYVGNFVTIVTTSGLFLTSYLVYLT